jgi:hypothetical protein
MIEMLDDGSKTNFILNTLNMVDISVWDNLKIEQLLDKFKNFVEEIFENNRLLMSYNPLMSIALSAELCDKISNAREKFKNDAKGLRDDILDLGATFEDKIED